MRLSVSYRLTVFALVAQGIEQQIPNLLAAGSIPAGGTIKNNKLYTYNVA
jgi:hypothetical protein